MDVSDSDRITRLTEDLATMTDLYKAVQAENGKYRRGHEAFQPRLMEFIRTAFDE